MSSTLLDFDNVHTNVTCDKVDLRVTPVPAIRWSGGSMVL